MKTAPIPANEEARLADLGSHALLDTLPETIFDDLTALAAEICGVPIALISLVDANRQWFKSRHGLDATETPRDVSFCGHAVADNEMLIVPDALEDERFADNPLVTSDPNVRFYAGAVLKSSRGHNLGTLCVIDNQPHKLSPTQIEHLQRLARQVEAQFELRKQALDATHLRELHAVSSRQDLSQVERIAHVLALGLKTFQMDVAVFGQVADCMYTVQFSAGDGAPPPATRVAVDETYCALTMEKLDVVALHDAPAQNPNHTASNSKYAAYLGVPVLVDNVPYGTLCFQAEAARERPFTEHEISLVGLFAEWLGHAIVREQARERLAGANRELKASNDELNQFAYVVSHDLKAPLRAIGSLANWLEEDMDGDISEPVRGHLDKLTSRVHRMDGLINGILEYSRVSRLKAKPDRVPMDSLLKEVVDSLAPPPSFRVDIGDELPTLSGDPVRLHQVFANLIGNSIKYHDRPDGCVTVSHQTRGTDELFCVADDGPGIEPEYRDKVFQVFQTLTARDVKESTGIGLSIVKRIIENNGGRIWIESANGRGAAFFFTWPKVSQ